MKFHNYLKEGLFSFVDDIKDERSFSEIKKYLLDLKSYPNFDDYFDNVVESITPNAPETDRDIEIKYNYIGSNLAIVAGLYYSDELSLERIKDDYAEEIVTHLLDDESLKQQVMTFTHHLLFGKESSGVDTVGNLQIEQEGLIPMMDRIMTEVEGDLAQKNELMKHFRVYQLLSEKCLEEAAEAAKHDPHLTLLRNTLSNRGEARSYVIAHIVEEPDSKESETRGISFVDKYASDKKSSGSKKSVGFSQNL